MVAMGRSLLFADFLLGLEASDPVIANPILIMNIEIAY